MVSTMLLRKINKPSHLCDIYYFKSNKNKQTIWNEEYLEFHLSYILENMLDVESFSSQPKGFHYSFQDKIIPYTPDFCVTYIDGRQEYIDVKSVRGLFNDEQFIDKFKAKKAVAESQGMSLILITGAQLKDDAIVDNLKLLHRYKATEFNHQEPIYKHIIDFVSTNPHCHLSDIPSNNNFSSVSIKIAVFELLNEGLINSQITESFANNPILFVDNNTCFKGIDLEDELDILINNQELYKAQCPSDNDEHYERDADSFGEELKSEGMERFKLYSLIDKQLTRGWTQKNLEPLIDELIDEVNIPKPSWRTVAAWHKGYVDSDCDIKVFIKHHYRKGNRTKRVCGDEAFFDDAAKRYLDAKRPSVALTYRYYRDRILVHNEQLESNFKVPIITYKTFNQRIKALQPYDTMVKRHGKFKAQSSFFFRGTFKPCTRVLERVEIDHTPLNIILLDDKTHTPLGRPNLTCLIDVFSGCILGFHIAYKAPSYETVRAAMIHAVMPKDYVKDFNCPPKKSWPCQGIMELLVCDNGKDFKSNSLEHACYEAGINLQFNRVRTPQSKPHIESFFNTVERLFSSRFPGKTFCNILEKGEYRPEKDAVMHFSVFNELFHHWLIDVYHQQPNSAKTRIPIERWKEGIAALPPKTMTLNEQNSFQIMMGTKLTRKLTRRGFQIYNLRFDSPELEKYQKRYAQTRQSSFKTIKINPSNLSSIYVFIEEFNQYIQVPCVSNTGIKNVSLTQHLKQCQVSRKYISDKTDDLSIAKANLYITERMDAEQNKKTNSKNPSIKSAKKQAVYSSISSQGKGTITAEDTPQDCKDKQEKEPKNTDSVRERWKRLKNAKN